MESKKVAVLVGSLRKESFNRKIANVLIELSPHNLNLKILEIEKLQMYNEDLDATPPSEWTQFRQQLSDYDALLFVTPEYNRSVPAVLKNALDVGSRPYGASAWNAKPGAVVSVSVGAVGGFGANHHLRQSLVFLNVPAMPEPEAYIGDVAKLFNESGKLINDSTEKYLKKFMLAFSDWVHTNAKAQSQPQPPAEDLKKKLETEAEEETYMYNSKATSSSYDRFFRFQIFKFAGLGG
jgi:chromate reductase